MSERKLPSILFILGFAFFVFAGTTGPAQTTGEKAPSFTLKLLNGGDLKSSELQGKVTVLKFIASY